VCGIRLRSQQENEHDAGGEVEEVVQAREAIAEARAVFAH
jgi:hypothetical protein